MAPSTRRPTWRALVAVALVVATAALTADSTYTASTRPSSDEVIAAGPLPEAGPHRRSASAEPHPALPHGADIDAIAPVTTSPPDTVAPAPITTPPPTVLRPAPTAPPVTAAAPLAPVEPVVVGPPPIVPIAPDGSVPCPLTPQAEPCWASHTGVPGWSGAQIVAGRSPLEHLVGDVTVTQAGTVIDGKWIDGCVAVKANDVTIRNTLVRTQHSCYGGNGQAAGSAINTGNQERGVPGVVTGLVVQDTEVDAMDASYDFAGIGAHGYTCVRCNVHGGVKNLWATSNVTIRESYIHHPSVANGSIHSESIDSDSGSHITISHSYINAKGPTVVTGAVAFLASWGPGDDLTIDASYLEGNRGADLATAPDNHTIRITNNAFSADNGYDGATFVYGFARTNPGMVWSGNYVPQTGAELPIPDSP